jgi:hypothetical protein
MPSFRPGDGIKVSDVIEGLTVRNATLTGNEFNFNANDGLIWLGVPVRANAIQASAMVAARARASAPRTLGRNLQQLVGIVPHDLPKDVVRG